jgi:hypothetical protein
MPVVGCRSLGADEPYAKALVDAGTVRSNTNSPATPRRIGVAAVGVRRALLPVMALDKLAADDVLPSR